MRKLIFVIISFLTACGGGGGASVSNQPAQSSITNNEIISDICPVLKTYTSEYPNHFQGSYAIPTPADKFDNNMMRGVGVKDYYPGCNVEWSYTVDRIKATGADTIEIYPAGRVSDFSASTWIVKDEDWGIPKVNLAWFIKEAQRKGLKVTLIWQFIPVDMKDVYINTNNPTENETIRFLRGWNDIVVELAKFSAANKVDNLQVQWNAFSYPVINYPETSTIEFVKIINNVRNVFSGKIFMGWPRFYDKRVIEKVDAIVIPLTPSNWSYMDDANMSVSLLKQRYMDAITGIYLDYSLNSKMDTKNIPIIWDFNIQSRDKALSQGWIEDGFCTTLNNDVWPLAYSDARCIQKTYVTDFSVQALAFEGAFQAIKNQTYFKNYGANLSTSYWHTDMLTPGDAGFPNLSQSIRGKPAENIVKYWYQK